MDDKRLKGIKDSYSNCVDIALSNNETLPEYEIEVADLNFLIKTIEEQQKEIERLKEGFKGADHLVHEYHKEKQQLKTVIEKVKHYLSNDPDSPFMPIYQNLLEYIVHLEMVVKK